MERNGAGELQKKRVKRYGMPLQKRKVILLILPTNITMASLRGWSPFMGLQIQYSLVERTPERELLPMAQALDIGVTAWSPLGGGVLTGKYTTKKEQEKSSEPKRLSPDNPFGELFLKERYLQIAEEVCKMADEINNTPAQVSLNWLRHRSGVIIPIIGARTEVQLRDNLGCLGFELTKEQLQRLDDASRIEPGFPHDFLANDMVKNFIYGNTLPWIDNHRNS